MLALSFVPSAFATAELKYDDGGDEGGLSHSTNMYIAVKFSLPDGWSCAKIRTAKYFIMTGSLLSAFKVHILGSDGCQELLTPAPTHAPTATNAFFSVDLTSYGIVVSEDFYVVIEYLTDWTPTIGRDTTSPDGRTYYGVPCSLSQETNYDAMIRAEVDPCPVGGVVLSVDKLAVLSPWLMAMGLASAVAVVSFVVKKRRA